MSLPTTLLKYYFLVTRLFYCFRDQNGGEKKAVKQIKLLENEKYAW